MTEEPGENTEVRQIILIHNEISLRGKIKNYFTNKAILASLILTGITIGTSYKLYPDYSYLNSILTVIDTSLLTLFLLIIWERYNSENKKNALLCSFTNELMRNLSNLISNNTKLNKELANLNENDTGYHRLKEVQLNVYELILQTFPEEIANIGYINIEMYLSMSKEHNHCLELRDKLAINSNRTTEKYKEVILPLDQDLITLIGVIVQYICKIEPNMEIKDLKTDIIMKLSETGELKKYLNLKTQALIGEYANKQSSKIFNFNFIRTIIQKKYNM